MADNSPSNDPKIQDYALLKSERRYIGDIILIGAEIDHLISVALFKTSQIHADIGFSLFGRATIGTKLKSLRTMVKFECTELQQTQFKKIEQDLDDFIARRNMFAHGLYMGVLDNMLCYLTTADPFQDGEDIIFKLKRFGHKDFRPCIAVGQALVVSIMSIFEIRTLRGAAPYTLRDKKCRSLK